jgi:hypothetical protein
MAAGDTYQQVRLTDRWIYDASGNMVGVQNNRGNGLDMRGLTTAQTAAISAHTAAHMQSSGLSVVNGSYGGNCWQQTEVMPFDWDTLELAFLHTGTTAMANMTAIAAVSDTMAADPAPTQFGTTFGATIAAGSFQRITWAGSNTAPTLAAPGTGLYQIGGWSDKLALPSLARTDAGVGRILMVRAYCGGGNASTMSNSGAGANYTGWTEAQAATQGVPYAYSRGWLQAVDGVTTPSAFSAAARRVDWYSTMKRFTLGGKPIPSVLFMGDSRFQTAATTTAALDAGYHEFSSVPHKVQSILAAKGYNIAIQQCGESGSATSTALGAARAYPTLGVTMVQTLRPIAVVYMVHSVNDTAGDDFASTLIDSMLATANAVRMACAAVGAAFIPVAHYPYNSALSAAQLVQAARVTAYCASFAAYSNPSQLLGNAADNTWRADIPNDGTHCGNLGRALQANEIARAVLQTCYA